MENLVMGICIDIAKVKVKVCMDIFSWLQFYIHVSVLHGSGNGIPVL